MPKILTPAMRAHLDEATTRLCTAWRIERPDGQSFFFTDHDRDLVYGGNTYLAATGFDRTAIKSDLTFAVDNLDLVGITDPGQINETEIRAGLFDGADVYIFLLVFDDPDTHGELKLRKGRLGQTRLTPQGYFTAEIRSLAQPLAQSTLKVITPECTVDVGSAACTFPIWPAEVGREVAYAAGQFVRASNSGGALSEDFDDRIYECVTAGTTAAVHEWALTWEHIDLDPGDVVTFALKGGRSFTVRILRFDIGRNLEIRLETVAQDSSSYDVKALADGGRTFNRVVVAPSDFTQLVLADSPLLADGDDADRKSSGLYWAIGGIGQPGWTAGVVFESRDGAGYAILDESTTEMTWGVCQSALGDTDVR